MLSVLFLWKNRCEPQPPDSGHGVVHRREATSVHRSRGLFLGHCWELSGLLLCCFFSGSKLDYFDHDWASFKWNHVVLYKGYWSRSLCYICSTLHVRRWTIDQHTIIWIVWIIFLFTVLKSEEVVPHFECHNSFSENTIILFLYIFVIWWRVRLEWI